MSKSHQTGMSGSKAEVYEETLSALEHLLLEDDDLIASLANTAALLKCNLSWVSWVGFYLARDEELVLGPFQGKPACVRIRFGRGVCGKAAAERQTLIVEDVRLFADHIACDPLSRSEIVVPIILAGKVVGVLDADSEQVGSFNLDDEHYLKKVVGLLENKFALLFENLT
jgi:L-methionine (R)-S-oxide reductase